MTDTVKSIVFKILENVYRTILTHGMRGDCLLLLTFPPDFTDEQKHILRNLFIIVNYRNNQGVEQRLDPRWIYAYPHTEDASSILVDLKIQGSVERVTFLAPEHDHPDEIVGYDTIIQLYPTRRT